MIFENNKEFALADFPFAQKDDHKYSRGAVLIRGGGIGATGAACLAATAALRMAGLVSVVCNREALPIYAVKLNAVMTILADHIDDFHQILQSKKFSSLLIGPNNGVDYATYETILSALEYDLNLILDADALSCLAEQKFDYSKLSGENILTPHEGEFKRLFDGKINPQKPRDYRAQKAAELTGAVVVLKGAETIIAAPDGKTAINRNAPAQLATAGSGDVLAGIIAGLCSSKKLSSFQAACAGVWLHGEAANLFGVGLTADDLPNMLAKVLNNHTTRHFSC